MAKNYVLAPDSTGDVHTSPLLKSGSVKKTKFELGKPDTLDQEDLEFLFKNKYTPLVIELDVPDPIPSKGKKNPPVDPPTE